MMNNMPGGGYMPEDPELSYLPEEKDVLTQKDPALRKAAEEFVSNYILSDNTGDAAWEAYPKKMENLGVNEVIAVANAAQKRY